MPTTVATMAEYTVAMPQVPMSAHTAMPHTAITMDTHTGMEPIGSTSVKPRQSQRLMLMPTMLVPMDMEDSLPIVDMVSTHTAHTATDIPVQLTTDLMPTVVSTSVMPRLSQRLMLMPTMLVPMDMEDSLPTVDMVPTHTAHTATDILAQLTTDLMPTVVSTSVMLRPSQRLMLTTVSTMDTQPTAHTDMELTHTGTTDMVAHTDTDTTTKCLLKLCS